MNTTTTKSPGFNEYHHSVSSFYTQITREYRHFRRPSFTEYRQKKKYERVSNETALLAIFSHILPLNTTNFYALGLKKICASFIIRVTFYVYRIYKNLRYKFWFCVGLFFAWFLRWHSSLHYQNGLLQLLC